MESNFSMIEKIPPKGVSFSDFICTFSMPCYDFRLFSNCNTKISEKSRQAKIINDVAKVQIKSEKITPFGGIFHVREHFSRFVGPVIDKVIGLRCTSVGYQSARLWVLCRHDPCIITSVVARLSSDGEANCKISQRQY